MQIQSSALEIDEQLSAYFDDELEASTRAVVDAELEANPELAAHLADLEFMRTIVVGDLDHQAERVPEARFEQIWDSFEQTLDRESRLQEAAEAPPSLWERLSSWVRPIRVPVAAVAAAGALVFVFARSAGEPSEIEAEDDGAVASNTQEDQASDAQPSKQARQSPAVTPSAPAPEIGPIAVAPEPSPEVDPEMFPQPEPGQAEIRRIEFGGQTGTISQVEGSRGTTTVIWVTEDEAPVDSERSL
ncbi:hypothetical protein ENSA5_34270 [Enhygromyxa salina]|uniref:Zinc-finger domain-containing protein n=1 Tax=Enhygromyxa salina TaxID=215803 RepID=A0A2S9XX47_9BACT|nr:hypothetical protein [Enhygromyxa salina]PRP97435.1 hypothetical protein ENSA5_34270 [Enhygromyxa salina]